MKHFKKGRQSILFAVVALVVAACAASGEAETGSPPTSAEAAPDTTADESPGTSEGSSTSETSVAPTGPTLPDETPAVSQVPDGVDIVVEVTMDEFSFDPDPIGVLAGLTYHYVITNNGLLPHEFRLSNPHRIEEHMAAGHDDHGNADDGHEETGDVFIELEPGETGELTMTFSTDATLYTHAACLLPGHYEAGMVTDLIYVDA